MLSFCKKKLFNFFLVFYYFSDYEKKLKKFFGQNSKSWFVYFTNQEIPQVRFFFGEKATLKESYEPSLGKLRWPAFFMTVYPTVSPPKISDLATALIVSNLNSNSLNLVDTMAKTELLYLKNAGA